MQKRTIFFWVFFLTLLQLYSHCVQQCYLISLQKVYEISRKVLPNDLVPSLHDTINMARLKVLGERVFFVLFFYIFRFGLWLGSTIPHSLLCIQFCCYTIKKCGPSLNSIPRKTVILKYASFMPISFNISLEERVSSNFEITCCVECRQAIAMSNRKLLGNKISSICKLKNIGSTCMPKINCLN